MRTRITLGRCPSCRRPIVDDEWDMSGKTGLPCDDYDASGQDGVPFCDECLITMESAPSNNSRPRPCRVN